jgi:hypothetical protein
MYVIIKMDNYASGAIGGTAVVVLGILYKVFTLVNHHRLVSKCCGKAIEVSIDVDETTPKSNSYYRCPRRKCISKQ